jgi:hypothetical protein
MLLYGSTKEGREPYKLTKIYTHDLETEEINKYNEHDFPNYFSIRKYADNDKIELL